MMNKLRNIGIIAHINAGKTTTSERILFHAGQTSTVGDVDKGNTITDYLIQERDRGITITSAVVTYNWRKHRINLIDTPGHVDFTFEVERSLSVLDGAVTILDSSAGVEAQTVTVWNQASKYKLPNIIYLNKYDKFQANYRFCLKHLKLNLDVTPALLQIPIKVSKTDLSLIDVITRKHLRWINPDQDNGAKFDALDLADSKLDKFHLDQVDESREQLINLLSDIDSNLANHVIECDRIGDVSSEQINLALRRATLACKLSPVLIGSSFKYIGVQQLMDAINDYLPDPIERQSQIRAALKLISSDESSQAHRKSETCAFIFKINHDKRLGPLSFLKVCSGEVKKQQRLTLLASKRPEQIKKVYRVFADELIELQGSAIKNDIVVVTGLNEARTGDILVDGSLLQFGKDHYDGVDDEQLEDYDTSAINGSLGTLTGAAEALDLNGGVEFDQAAESESMPFETLGPREKSILVPQIKQMEPVYYCTIESLNAAEQLKMEHALCCLAREDPSLSYEIDRLGITTIRGMGKLHLEVVRDRIESEYKIRPSLGPLQISYRETIEGQVEEQLEVAKLIKSSNNMVSISLRLKSSPNIGTWSGRLLRLDTSAHSEGTISLDKLRWKHRKAIELGFKSALQHGPKGGYQVIDCEITLLAFSANGRCGMPVIASAASQCLANAIQRCSPKLLEPIMSVEIVIPKEFTGQIIGDLSQRRGLIKSTEAKLDNLMMIVKGEVPLATLSDYSEYLRVTTSGRGSFSLELSSYAPV